MELTAIDRTDWSQAMLDGALGRYRHAILPEAQNPEHLILYWIDHSRETVADQFRFLTIPEGIEVIGYLQYRFFAGQIRTLQNRRAYTIFNSSTSLPREAGRTTSASTKPAPDCVPLLGAGIPLFARHD